MTITKYLEQKKYLEQEPRKIKQKEAYTTL